MSSIDTSKVVRDLLYDGTRLSLQGQGYPIEIDTAAGMDAVLVAANVGKVYLYTGTTTSDYTNGELYIVRGS